MFDVAVLTEECRKAAGEDAAFASDDELLAAAIEYQAARSAFDAGEAHVLAELRVRGVTDRCFGLRTAKWVAGQAKVDHRPIGRRTRFGLGLRHLPAVDAAVTEGSITVDHAEVLADAAANPRIGDQVAATAPIWVGQAAETSFVDWRHQLQQTVRLLDADGGYDPDRDRDRMRARFDTFDAGLTRLTADLVGVDALAVRQLVEDHADRLFHQLKNDASKTSDLPMPSRATLLAMALAELVRRGSIVDRDTTTGPAVDVTLTIEATPPAAIEATEATGNPLVEHCGPPTTGDDEHVHPKLAALLLCDPVITALVIETLGVPLNMGRQIRLANRKQRRAVGRRDRGCVFPGCDAPTSWCDVHHVIWWDHDGPTDTWNLALLCRYHHGITHRRGWTMTTTGDEWFTWTTPSGDTLHSQRHRGRSPTAHRHPAHA